jgi:hypothetical protein
MVVGGSSSSNINNNNNNNNVYRLQNKHSIGAIMPTVM